MKNRSTQLNNDDKSGRSDGATNISLTLIMNRFWSQLFCFCGVVFFVLNFLFLGFGCYFTHKFYSLYISYRVFHAFIQITLEDFKPDSTHFYVLPKRVIPNWQKDWHLCLITIVLLAYKAYRTVTRRQEERGGNIIEEMRRFWAWKYIAKYFPIKLVPSDELYQYADSVKTENNNENVCKQEKSELNHHLMNGSLNTSSLLDDSGLSDESSHETALESAVVKRTGKNSQPSTGGTVPAEPAIVFDNDEKFADPVHLPTDRNYLVGCHPHGIFSIGAFFNFATEVTGFNKIFPKINHYLAILKIHFGGPLYREYLMSFGVVSVSRPSLRYLLDPKICRQTGNMVVVIVGGAPEALDSVPGLYCVHLKTRHGFFKMALETGASLLPAISFGETNTYWQAPNRPGSYLRRLQEFLMSILSFSMPLIFAIGPFPYKRRITTVVGAPVPCKKIDRPSFDDINELRSRYITALTNLFNKYKPIYDPNAGDIFFC